MLFAEGPAACPFVALENDRDRRSDEPDARHRCYAVPVPEPRALAHQRAYCLTAEFASCPIFQDWAVRAAARPVPLRPVPGPLPPEEQERIGAWATPPPWQHDARIDAAAREAAARESEPAQLGAFERVGSEAPASPAPGAQSPAEAPAPTAPTAPTPPSEAQIERLPSLPLDAPSELADEADDGPAAAAGTAPVTGKRAAVEPPIADVSPPAERLQPPTYRSAAQQEPLRPDLGRSDAPGPEPAARRRWDRRDAERAGAASTGRERPTPSRAGQPDGRDKPTLRREDVVPAWQRGRYDAYPSLGKRLDLGGGGGGSWLSRITTLFAVLAILGLAVALVLLAPGLLGLVGPGASSTPPIGAVSPSPSGATGSPAPTVSPSATPLPHETWQVYVIQSGDSICRIAARFGITYAQLMGANPEITNPAFIRAGDQIDIPPEDFVPPSPAPDATPLGNPCG